MSSVEPNYFAILPEELTCHILSFVTSVKKAELSRVSKLFYRTAEESWLKDLRKCGEERDLKITAKKQLANRYIKCALFAYEVLGIEHPSKENVFKGECHIAPSLKKIAISRIFDKFSAIYSDLCANFPDNKAVNLSVSYDRHLQFLLDEKAELPKFVVEHDPFRGTIHIDTLMTVLNYRCSTLTIKLVVEKNFKVMSSHLSNAYYQGHPYSTLSYLVDKMDEKISLQTLMILIDGLFPCDMILKAISKSAKISGHFICYALDKPVNEFILSALVERFDDDYYYEPNKLINSFFCKFREGVYSFPVFEKMIDKLPKAKITCLWNSLGEYPTEVVLKLISIETNLFEGHLLRALTYQPDHEIIKRLIGETRLTNLNVLYSALTGNYELKGVEKALIASDETILMVIDAFNSDDLYLETEYIYRALKYNHSDTVLKALLNITSNVDLSLFQLAKTKKRSEEIMDLFRAKCVLNERQLLI